jgi:hypothetical protein
MVWALFRIALFGGSFLIGLFFFGPAPPVHVKAETTISVPKKFPISPKKLQKPKKPFVLFVADSPTSSARGYGRLSIPM